MPGPLKDKRRERFALNIVAGMSTADAYIDAEYKGKTPGTIRTNAGRMLNNADISARIAELRERVADVVVQKTGIDRARWLEQIRRHAFGDIRRVVTWKANATGMHEDEETGEVRLAITNQVQLVDADQLSEEDAAMVRGVKMTDKGGLTLTTADPIRALQLYGQAEGWIGDPDNDVNLTVSFVRGPEPEGYDAWVQRKQREREARMLNVTPPKAAE